MTGSSLRRYRGRLAGRGASWWTRSAWRNGLGWTSASSRPTSTRAPSRYADLVTTTTHKTLRGPRGGLVFSRRELPGHVDAADYPAVKGSLAASVDRTVFPGIQGGPLMHVIAAKAVAFKLAAEEPFREDQRRTIANAQVLASTLTGLVPGSCPAARTTTCCWWTSRRSA